MIPGNTTGLDDLANIIPDENIMTSTGYYRAVTKGISGHHFKRIVHNLNEREVFAQVLNTDKSNLSKHYRKDRLPTSAGDNIIDALRIYIQATRIFGTLATAQEWLHTAVPALGGEIPAKLLTTHAGRELVRQTLNKIEYGDFS